MVRMNCMRIYVHLLLGLTLCWALPLTGGPGGQTVAGQESSGAEQAAAMGQDGNAQDEDGGLSPPSLTRLSFSALQHSSSNSYSSNCCHIVPDLCTSQGKCALNVTDCVSFCICARSPDLPWCSGELQRLHSVLQHQRRKTKQDRGSTDGNDGLGPADGVGSDTDSDTLSGSPHIGGFDTASGDHFPSPALSMAIGSMSLNEATGSSPGGMMLGSLTPGGEEPGPSEDNVMSPAQLASALSRAQRPNLPSSSLLDREDVNGSLINRPPSDHEAPPLFPMMSGEAQTVDNAKHGGNRLNSNRTSSSSGTETRLGNSSNTGGKLLSLLHPQKADSVKEGENVTTDGQVVLPWWPNDDDSCGTECALNGGRCVFDFNRTYTQVCIYDSVKPCHKLNCLYGTCVAQNGSYSCQCHDGWDGIFCDKKCQLDCGPHGHCVVMAGNVACECQHNYTGIHCDDLKPTPAPIAGAVVHGDVVTVWQIAAGCLGVAAGLLVLLLLLGYVTWRRQWLPMRKLVHYFQHYEEDDGKEYDAFISYRSRSSDEMFVLHELYPHLERHLDFKLCMHFRDFAPGETIADNIIQAIENSRRTILILSPAYVQSEWCRLEYQKAQHEMLKMRHKIIPIMIEDVTHVQPMDRNLRTVLDTVTYIKWPGNEDPKRADKFWKLLQLSMPKKKSDYTRSLSSTESCSSDRPLTAVSSSCFTNVVSSMSTSPTTTNNLHPQRSLSITSSIEEVAAEEDEEAEKVEVREKGTKKCPDGVERCSDVRDVKHELQGSESKTLNCDNNPYNDGDWSSLRDRASSCHSELGDQPPDPGDAETSLNVGNSDDDIGQVTSDDHIVKIEDISGDKVLVTPWVPARLASRC